MTHIKFKIICGYCSIALFWGGCEIAPRDNIYDPGGDNYVGTTSTDPEAPVVAPSNLRATAVSYDRIDLIWNDLSENEDGFSVERRFGTTPFSQVAVLGPGSQQYVDTDNLNENTRYYYRTRAFRQGIQSDYSNEASAVTAYSPVLSPSNLTASTFSADSISLSWTDNSADEEGFLIERSQDGFTFLQRYGTAANVTSWNDSSLFPNTRYYYRIRALKASIFSGYSNISSDVTADVIPTAPSGLSATAWTDRLEIVLSWSDTSDNEQGFRIERSVNGGGFQQLAATAPGATEHVDTSNLSPGTTYYYRVCAFNAMGISNYSNVASTTTAEVPQAPRNATATIVSSSSILIQWDEDSSVENGFSVERKLGVSGTYALIATPIANTTEFTDNGLAPASTYYYRISAFNAIGDSAYSNECYATTSDTVPASPSELQATALSSTQIRLSWTDNSPNESTFIIERRIDGGSFAWAAEVSANTCSYINTGLSPGTAYYFRIKARNSAGDSAYSAIAWVTTPVPSSAQIIADHTVVDRYNAIPQYYIDQVKKMLVDMAGESHSAAYRIGQDLLELLDPRYQVLTYNGSRPPYSDQYLRIGTHGSVGEANFYTSQAAIDAYKSHISGQYGTGNPYTVMGFGWCWDMTWTNAPGGGLDPVYNVHWAGSSDGGPDGNNRWGLDSGDQVLTGNSVCMDTYLHAVEQYIRHCADNGYPTRMVFTTGPVDGNGGTENGFQREIKHDYIRSYVAADPSRILFDYADILCWSNSGARNTVTWNDSGTPLPHAQIHPDNMMDYDLSWNPIAHTEDGDHIGEVGALRLAKAMWWMLARIAGWDGISQ